MTINSPPTRRRALGSWAFIAIVPGLDANSHCGGGVPGLLFEHLWPHHLQLPFSASDLQISRFLARHADTPLCIFKNNIMRDRPSIISKLHDCSRTADNCSA